MAKRVGPKVPQDLSMESGLGHLRTKVKLVICALVVYIFPPFWPPVLDPHFRGSKFVSIHFV